MKSIDSNVEVYMCQTWLLVAVYGSSTFEPGLKNIKMLKYTLIDGNSYMQHKILHNACMLHKI